MTDAPKRKRKNGGDFYTEGEAALQYLSDTGQLMEQIANLKDRESCLVDLLDRITNYQAVIDCLSMPELNEVSCTLAAYEKP